MQQKTFFHHNPSTGVSVVVKAVQTRHSKFANKKESIDYYMNHLMKDNCDQTSRN